MPHPTVSIITICRNSASTINKTIESVISQKDGGVEYIIVDGLSTDTTLDIISSYEGIDRIVSESDRGIADAFNKGIKLASGDIVGLINSDDQLCTNALAMVRSYFNAHPDVDVVHGDVILIDGSRSIKCIKPPSYWWNPWRLVLFNHPATFVRREVYERHGLFDTTYRIAMDVEIFFRWMTNRVRISYLPEVLVKMQSGGASGRQAFTGYCEVRRAALTYRFNRFLTDMQFLGKLTVWGLLSTYGWIMRVVMPDKSDQGHQ
jgi:glycosyltransferase involved in cell wall biosynthesis